jgi:hypothetical protein
MDDAESDDELIFEKYMCDRGDDMLLSDPENMWKCPLWNGTEQTGISGSHDDKMALHFTRHNRCESDPQETVPIACRPRRQSAEVAKARLWDMNNTGRSETRQTPLSCEKQIRRSYTESPTTAQVLVKFHDEIEKRGLLHKTEPHAQCEGERCTQTAAMCEEQFYAALEAFSGTASPSVVHAEAASTVALSTPTAALPTLGEVSLILKIAGVAVGKECSATMLLSSNRGKRSHALQRIDANKKQCMHEVESDKKVMPQTVGTKAVIRARGQKAFYLCGKCRKPKLGHTCTANKLAPTSAEFNNE